MRASVNLDSGQTLISMLVKKVIMKMYCIRNCIVIICIKTIMHTVFEYYLICSIYIYIYIYIYICIRIYTYIYVSNVLIGLHIANSYEAHLFIIAVVQKENENTPHVTY